MTSITSFSKLAVPFAAALGTDYMKAVERAETVLLPAFDEWRIGLNAATLGASAAANISPIAASGSLDWVFAEYRADRRFTKLDARTKRNHEVGFRMVGGYVLKDGRRLGTLKLAAIDTSLVDELYGKLLFVKEADDDGKVIERERRTTVNHAMKSCRRAWNVAARRNPGKLPQVNPFAAMGLESSDRETPTATFTELQTFRAKAIEMGLPVAGDGGADRLGVAAARGTYLRHVRGRALPAKGAPERGSYPPQEDR